MTTIERGIHKVITKKGHIRYKVKLKDNQRRWYRSRTFSELRQAKAYKETLLRRRESGIDAACRDLGAATLSDFWDLWHAECRTLLVPGTLEAERRDWELHIKPLLGSLKMEEIRPQHVGDFLRSKLQSGKSTQTVRHFYQQLHKMFADAVEHYEALERNPVRKTFRPKVIRALKPYLKPRESLQILEYSKNTLLGPAIWLGLLVGLRCEAIQPLEWDGVDFEANEIRIRKFYKRKERLVKGYPKGRVQEYVPMVPRLAEYLRSLRKDATSRFVAPGHNGKMLLYETLYAGLKRICREAGVTVVSPHGLRHSCTELWMLAGANVEDIRRLLNHSCTETTMTYIHRSDDRLKDIGIGVANSLAPISTLLEAAKVPYLRLVKA
jgi:integrase